MYQAVRSKAFFHLVLLIIGIALGTSAFSSELREVSDRHAGNEPGLGSVVKYSGMAQVGSAVHDWISRMVPTTPDYPIPYSIEIHGELAQAGFSGLEEFVALAESQPRNLGKKGGELEHSRKEGSSPVGIIPVPTKPGTPGSTNNGTACSVMFGESAQRADIDYEWAWMPTDTNSGGAADPATARDWHLTSYSVTFSEESTGMDHC